MHVTVLRWPEEAGLRRALGVHRQPRLLLVPIEQAPPTDLDELEDWVWLDARPMEVQARVATLAQRGDRTERPTPVVDDDGVVHVGERWIALGPTEARVARVLSERVGAVVARGEVERAAWGDANVRANTTDRQMHRLRSHLAAVGMTVRTVRGRGYVLEPLRDVS